MGHGRYWCRDDQLPIAKSSIFMAKQHYEIRCVWLFGMAFSALPCPPDALVHSALDKMTGSANLTP
jgi:hypothetical protein